MLDLKITGGTVIDGISAKGYRADVGIIGEKIAAIGDLRELPARRTLTADGQIVAPGFIDLHTHSDMSLLYDGTASAKVHDGVTTEVIGNCGIGVAPICQEQKELLLTYLTTRLIGTIPVKLELPWNTMGEYLRHLEAHPPAVNVAPLLAQGVIRINEMGFAAGAPTADQMKRMKEQIHLAMEEGCFGFSSGLMYLPGEFSTSDEIGELCQAVAPYGGFYVTHIRSESNDMFGALEEAIAAAKKGGVPLHISHLKLAGPKVRGRIEELFGLFEKNRREGLDMTFDVYPYARGCTSLGACISPWAFEGGTEKMLERLRDPAIRQRVRQDIANGIPGWQNNANACGSYEGITIANVSTPQGQQMLGKTVQQVADERGIDGFDAMCDILIEEQGKVQVLTHIMNEDDVEAILAHPDSMIISDSQSLSTQGILSHGKPHPRAFGSRSRVLGYYVRQRKLFSLEKAVKKMTSAPAKRLGLVDRGALRVGNFADITVFDPETVTDHATYLDPKQYSTGYRAVIVNGAVALENDLQTDSLTGRVLRRR